MGPERAESSRQKELGGGASGATAGHVGAATFSCCCLAIVASVPAIVLFCGGKSLPLAVDALYCCPLVIREVGDKGMAGHPAASGLCPPAPSLPLVPSPWSRLLARLQSPNEQLRPHVVTLDESNRVGGAAAASPRAAPQAGSATAAAASFPVFPYHALCI